MKLSSAYKGFFAINILFCVISMFSCSSIPKESPIIYSKTYGQPVVYENYYISPQKIIRIEEKNGSKSKSEVNISPAKFEKLVKVLKDNNFPFIKESFSKRIGTDGIRITTNLPEMKTSKSNAGGIFPADEKKWNEIIQALEEIINSEL